MESVDIEVLRQAVHWLDAGQAVTLVTVVRTWGSSPRPVGATLAVCADGRFAGSVSGGCIEADLIARIRSRGNAAGAPEILSYGATRDEARRYRLPCGGVLQLALEPLETSASLRQVLEAITAGRIVARRVDLRTGAARVSATDAWARLRLEEDALTTVHGPRWRVLIVGAGQLSRYVTLLALMLDYAVIVCDPREDYAASWDVPAARLIASMPDDAVLELGLDRHSAVLVLSHDPKLDDMALLEALKTDAFYVGALGSQLSNARRRERLALFDLTHEQIARLHGPVGVPIGSRTPPEIAVSILAEMTAVRHGVALSGRAGAADTAPASGRAPA